MEAEVRGEIYQSLIMISQKKIACGTGSEKTYFLGRLYVLGANEPGEISSGIERHNGDNKIVPRVLYRPHSLNIVPPGCFGL
jgi:hypothetical protein